MKTSTNKTRGDTHKAIANNTSSQKDQKSSGDAKQLSKVSQLKESSEEEALQPKLEPIQKKENNTGLPDNLKTGVEQLSGYAMDDVKVHYNSDKPRQLKALAYAQGTDIHVASGQEKHLAHEAWHVVQQKQGRVKPTVQLKEAVNINDDAGLENEADVMGAKALGMGQEVAQRVKAIPKLNQVNSLVKQLVKSSGNVVQLAEWKNGGDDKNATLYWDDLMDGVQWYSNGKVLWYKIKAKGSEDYSALEGQVKPWEEWHALRKVAHPEEYRPDYSAPLMGRYNDRYITDIRWEDKSGVDDSLGKIVRIEAFVKKPDSGTQSVYVNTYNVQTDTFSADWNQRLDDIKVGIQDPPALYNSDLLTVHRELARKFAMSQGIMPVDDSNGFQVSRHNINNDDWQNKIFPQLPISIRALLPGGLTVTRDAPRPFGQDKVVVLGDKQASNMWQVFETLIPNTKAVFNLVDQRYAGYVVYSWTFKSGSATATIRKA